jgi:uncharacterized membrane protein
MTDKPNRIGGLDVMRGVVMVLMAIDHVRVYSGQPPGGPTAGIFFTRWVTHFCAPAFVFLAGTGAFLHGRKLGDTRALARYLVTRGAVLVVLELTVLRVCWTFNFDFAHYLLAGVIWMLGWCMILMALVVRLPVRAIAIGGFAVVLFQQALNALPRITPGALNWLWQFVYTGGGGVQLGAGGPELAILYVIFPWVGVMAIGYAFGAIMTLEPAQRDRFCVRVGLAATGIFVVVATAIALLQPAGEDAHPLLFRILAQQKYPPSQLFLLMTLGPTIALIPLADRARGWFADVMTTFGRVPMFYYMLHIPLIHALALVVSFLREGHVNPWLFTNHPVRPPQVPDGYMWSLPLLYLVFAIAVALLYVPCRWYAGLKARRKDAWLSYI